VNAISSEVWDPFGTLHSALWIGGGQWAGKSTVARLLATRYGLTAYHYDYHDARAHNDRRIARRVRLGEPVADPDPDTVWVNTSPQEMADETLAGFPTRFEWTLDDLRGLVSGRPIIAEGWGLRPELVAPIIDSPRRMVVMVPTKHFVGASSTNCPVPPPSITRSATPIEHNATDSPETASSPTRPPAPLAAWASEF
jgi:hypothetical protein